MFDDSFEGAELPCVIIFAWFRIHLAVACETFSINRLFSHGKAPSTIEEAKAKAKEEVIASAKRLLAKAQAMRFTTQEVE